jgi:O-antigen/teichoic acid export membrane protein
MSNRVLAKNVFANVCRGGASATVLLLMPIFLTRILSKDAYGTWLLILQLSTYVNLLDFGIQTVVGRYVAHHSELGETSSRDSIASSALAILIGLATLAILGTSIFAWQLPNLFKGMPVVLYQDAQLSFLCIGLSLAISLPFSVFGGIFIGLQRYDIPAWIIGVSKLLGGFFVILIANVSHSIILMAVVMGLTNIGSGLWQFLAYKSVASDIRISIQGISRAASIEITSCCFSLSASTIAILLIYSLDSIIIGYFDYKSLVYYSLAASLTSFIISIHGAIFGVIMPKAAAIGAKQDRDELGYLLISTTRYGLIILIMTSLPLLVGAEWLLTLWVGASYANETALLLRVMVIGNFIRYIAAPYSTIALAVGEQRKIVLSPLIEGVVNVTISLILTAYYGSIGVAIGTVFGGLVSVCMHFMYNLPRTPIIKIENKKLMADAICRPFISVAPSILFWIVYKSINLTSSLDIIFILITVFINFVFTIKYTLYTSEWQIIKKNIFNMLHLVRFN